MARWNCLLALVACLAASTPSSSNASNLEHASAPKQLVMGQALNVAGVTRSFHLYLPAQPQGAPIVVLFHGYSSDADDLLGLNGAASPFKRWLEIAERENLLIAVPNGLFTSSDNKGWNDCRADGVGNSTADDVAFVSALLDHLIQEYGADARRVFASGVSNGGHMAIRLAEELPHRIAGFAAINASHAANSECGSAGLPVSALFMNGTADPLLPYQGGAMTGNRGMVVSTEDSVAVWNQRNGANGAAQIANLPDLNGSDGTTVERRRYSGGVSGTEVLLYKVLNGGHTPPSPTERFSPQALAILGRQNADIEMAEEVWEFFRDKQAGRVFPRLDGALYDPSSPGDGLFLASNDQVLSVAYFGYDADGKALWLVGAASVAQLIPREDADMVIELQQAGSQGNFLVPQHPGAAPLPAWGTLTLTLRCSQDTPPLLNGTARLSGRSGTKTMHVEGLIQAPEVCLP